MDLPECGGRTVVRDASVGRRGPAERGERSGLYEVSPIRDASRRATRLVKRTDTKLQLVADSEYDPQVHTLEQTTSMEHTVMGSVWDGWD